MQPVYGLCVLAYRMKSHGISGQSRSATTPTGLLLGMAGFENARKLAGEELRLSHFALVESSSMCKVYLSICNEVNPTHMCMHLLLLHFRLITRSSLLLLHSA